jgi:hypothetical protein
MPPAEPLLPVDASSPQSPIDPISRVCRSFLVLLLLTHFVCIANPGTHKFSQTQFTNGSCLALVPRPFAGSVHYRQQLVAKGRHIGQFQADQGQEVSLTCHCHCLCPTLSPPATPYRRRCTSYRSSRLMLTSTQLCQKGCLLLEQDHGQQEARRGRRSRRSRL